jgi:hypothetical protein
VLRLTPPHLSLDVQSDVQGRFEFWVEPGFIDLRAEAEELAAAKPAIRLSTSPFSPRAGRLFDAFVDARQGRRREARELIAGRVELSSAASELCDLHMLELVGDVAWQLRRPARAAGGAVARAPHGRAADHVRARATVLLQGGTECGTTTSVPRKPSELLERARANPQSLSFRELERLVVAIGYAFDRQSGSHRIYRCKGLPIINLQSAGKDAKPYQVRQVLGIIDEYALEVE